MKLFGFFLVYLILSKVELIVEEIIDIVEMFFYVVFEGEFIMCN